MLNWDRVKSETEIIIREMLYDDPRDVLREYEKERLKGIFLSNLHRFDKKNKSYWKLVLDVSDEEFTRAVKENFREAHKLRDY